MVPLLICGSGGEDPARVDDDGFDMVTGVRECFRWMDDIICIVGVLYSCIELFQVESGSCG